MFDVAERILLVQVGGSGEMSRREEPLPEEPPNLRARRVADLGVTALICGAISQPLEALLAARQIEVISQVCGDVEEVLEAFRAGALEDDRFIMPGCWGRTPRRRRGRCRRGGRWAKE